MPFDDLDDDFASLPQPGEPRKRAEISREQFQSLPAPQVPSGFFTLTLTDGSRKRFRIRLERGAFCTGQRTLSRYCKLGADDDAEREWESIGLVTADGFAIFKRWRNTYENLWAVQLWRLLNAGDESVPAASPGYSVEVEPRCWLTMRELKDEDGKRTGLCKTWRERFGIE